MKSLVAIAFIFLISLLVLMQIKKNSEPVLSVPSETSSSDFRLDYSEGECEVDANCQWAGDGCGGGHGVCTNSPAKYDGVMTTCDINDDFPANQGYSCGCIMTKGQCGWKK